MEKSVKYICVCNLVSAVNNLSYAFASASPWPKVRFRFAGSDPSSSNEGLVEGYHSQAWFVYKDPNS